MSLIYKTVKCNKCGKLVKTEICPDCGAANGLENIKTDYDFPKIKCDDTNITKEYYVLFVITSIVILFWLYVNSVLWRLFIHKDGFLFGLIYNSFMIAIINMFLTPIIKQYKTCMDIEDNGKEIEGIVYGTKYEGSNLRGSTVTYTIFKILVETKNGYRFVLYKMQNTNKKYKVNTKLKLKEHKGKYMLIGEITD